MENPQEEKIPRPSINTIVLYKSLIYFLTTGGVLSAVLLLLFGSLFIFLAGVAGMRALFANSTSDSYPDLILIISCSILLWIVPPYVLSNYSYSYIYTPMYFSIQTTEYIYRILGSAILAIGLIRWNKYKRKKRDISYGNKSGVTNKDDLSDDFVLLPAILFGFGGILAEYFDISYGIPLSILGFSIFLEDPINWIFRLVIPERVLNNKVSKTSNNDDFSNVE
jgi:hypothetical protein